MTQKLKLIFNIINLRKLPKILVIRNAVNLHKKELILNNSDSKDTVDFTVKFPTVVDSRDLFYTSKKSLKNKFYDLVCFTRNDDNNMVTVRQTDGWTTIEKDMTLHEDTELNKDAFCISNIGFIFYLMRD